MAGSTRAAHETNERASHAPKTVAEYAASKRHPAGCSCCGPSKPVAPTKANPHALKTSPSNRPWMLRHSGVTQPRGLPLDAVAEPLGHRHSPHPPDPATHQKHPYPNNP